MSTLIESTARGGASAIRSALNLGSGTNDAEHVARGKELVKQLAAGGAMLGGGAGLAVALVNYVKGLRAEQDAYDPEKLNDDTLYVGVNKSANDGINKWLLPGAAVAGGVLTAGGAYALTQALHGIIQRRRRQALLDEAQGEALTAADAEALKSAAEMTASDLVTAFPVAIPLLAAVASGGIAYAALDKAFPTLQRPKSRYPKRIRAVVNGEPQDVQGVEKDTMKSAGVEIAAQRSATECLLMTVDSLADNDFSVTSEFLAKAAAIGVDAVAADLYEHGLITTADMYKGASASTFEKLAAATLIASDPMLGPLMTHVAASEFISLLPGVSSLCAGMDADTREKSAGLAVLLYETVSRPDMVEKCAAGLSPELLAQLQELLSGGYVPGSQGVLGDTADAALTSDSGGATGQAEGGVGPAMESKGEDDIIDTAIEDPSTINMR